MKHRFMSGFLWHDLEKDINMEFLIELWVFAKERKKYWLYPLFIIILATMGLLVLVDGSAFAPFIYTLF